MILKTKLWGVVSILAISFLSHSQTYLISDGGTISTCSGTIYDSGGAGGSYSPDEDYTTSFCAPPGQCISITFATAPDFGPDSGNPRDRIIIYDGPTTAYANLGALNANTIGGLSFPLTITSTSGCLTLKFFSNSDATVGNFEATISCGACPVQPGYNNPVGFIYTCDAKFYDHRGPSTNYGNNQNRITKFCSSDGTCVRVTFNSFSTESGFDYLDI